MLENELQTLPHDEEAKYPPSNLDDLLKQWKTLTNIEHQRERTIEEHCQLGDVLIALLKHHIHDESPQNLPIDNHDKRILRNTFWLVASLEWIDEIAYGFFQFQMSYNGLIRFNVDARAVAIISGILATGDFLSNVTNFSPANDADEWLFNTHKPLKHSWLRKVATTINFISIIGSYIPGSTPGCTALLDYLPTNMSKDAFALTAAAMSLLAIPPGTAYYLGFHNGSMHKTFQALEDYIESSKKDFDPFRFIEMIKKVTGIVAYRALCFAFFTLAYLQSLKVQPNHVSFALSGFTFIATILNVIFSRLLPTLSETWNNDFAYITRQEFNQAKGQFTWLTLDRIGMIGINTLIAIGYGLILHTSTQDNHIIEKYLLSTSIATTILGISLYSQRQMAIYTKALADLDIGVLAQRKQKINQLPLHSPKDERLNIVRANFSWLAQTYKTPTLVNTANLLSVIGRMARIFSFYYFVYKLDKALALNLNKQILLGVCCAFAPDNIKNEWAIFMSGTIQTVTQKMAEAHVFHHHAPVKEYLGYIRDVFTIYNKAFLSYDLKVELLPAMEKRVAWLKNLENHPPKKIFSFKECFFGNNEISLRRPLISLNNPKPII